MNSVNPFQEFGLTAPPGSTKRQDELGQEDFLKLMITQFQSQDPFKPMQNGEFLGQMAQFGTVSGISELQSSVSNLSTSLTGNQTLQAATLVDREVLVPGQTGFLPPTGALRGAIEIPASSQTNIIEISDPSGALVKRIDLGKLSAGQADFAWDGHNDKGERMGSGSYTFKAITQHNGQNQAANSFVYAQVESVNLNGGVQDLTLNLTGLGDRRIDQVRQIQ